jgi:hypothetical protein
MKAPEWMVDTAEGLGEETRIIAAAVSEALPKRTVSVSHWTDSAIAENEEGLWYEYVFPKAVFVKLPLFFPLRIIKDAIRKNVEWNMDDDDDDDIGALADAEDLAMGIFYDPEVLTAILGGFVRGLNENIKSDLNGGRRYGEAPATPTGLGELDDVEYAWWDATENNSQYPEDHEDHEHFAPPSHLKADLVTKSGKLSHVSAEGDGLFAGVRATMTYTVVPERVEVITPNHHEWLDY